MLLSVKWLRDYVDVPFSTDELAHRLTMAGLEVEGIEDRGKNLQGIVTARLEDVAPHPNADRLRVCKAFDGEKRHAVVCGAPNIKDGDVVPLALPGTTIGDITLKKTKIRGQVSEGMLCSQRELGISDDHSGIWLLPADTPLGKPLAEAMGLDDVVIEVSITPNRGDCLSMIGLAREVAAFSGAKVRYPEYPLNETGPAVDTLAKVEIEDPIGCPRYTARVIQNIKIGPSPQWMQNRLRAAGVRAINNIVDITNYVMLELGQPLHAFDYDKVRDHRIVVRRAKTGEKFHTLDGVERDLSDKIVMICDGRGYVGVGGIMGGLESEITNTTTNVLLESAYFQPEAIRAGGRQLKLKSEACYRFERGVDRDGSLRACDRAAQLMVELGGGELATGAIDEHPSKPHQPTIQLRVDRANRFLGLNVETARMAELLESIEIPTKEVQPGVLECQGPTFRPDITREADLVEEVARLVGYNQIPTTYPKTIAYKEPVNSHLKTRDQIRAVLQTAGFCEVLSLSFISKQALASLRLPEDDPRNAPIPVLNPLSEEQAIMRTSLLPALLQTVASNLDRGNDDQRLFEIGKVFMPKTDHPLPDEPFNIVGALTGKRIPQLYHGGEDAIDFADVKGAVETIFQVFHLPPAEYNPEGLPAYIDPFQGARLLIDGVTVGAAGRLHPEVEQAYDVDQPVWVFDLYFEKLFEMRDPHPLYQQLPRFPSVTRDLALVLDENVPVAEPIKFISEQNEPLLMNLELFDLFRSEKLGEGKKSAGYRFIYRAPDRSLTDEEVNTIHQRLSEKAMEAFKAGVRQ